MSELRPGDSTTDIITDLTLPNDGDMRNAASVRVSLEAMQDSLTSIAKGGWTSRGHMVGDGLAITLIGGSFGAGASSTVSINTASSLIIDATSNFGLLGHGILSSGSILDAQAGSHVRINDGATAHVQSGGNITIDVGGKIEVLGGGASDGIDVHDTGIIHVHDSGIVRIESGGTLLISIDGIANVDGQLFIRNGGNVSVNFGGTVHVHDGGVVSFSAVAALQFAGTEILGSKVFSGPTVFAGNGAYRGQRFKKVLAGAATLDPSTFDFLTFTTDVDHDFTITLSDMPDDVAGHEFTFFANSSLGTGFTTFDVAFHDAHGFTAAHMAGNDWLNASLRLAYDPDPGAGQSRWQLVSRTKSI